MYKVASIFLIGIALVIGFSAYFATSSVFYPHPCGVIVYVKSGDESVTNAKVSIITPMSVLTWEDAWIDKKEVITGSQGVATFYIARPNKVTVVVDYEDKEYRANIEVFENEMVDVVVDVLHSTVVSESLVESSLLMYGISVTLFLSGVLLGFFGNREWKIQV